MTGQAVVPFQPPTPAGSSLELAPEAWKLATRVATTEFVPKGLRGKPEAVLACILAGHEAGLSPMTSLRSIHVVDGRPAMSAELMRALVLRAGHDLWTEETSSTRAIVCGQRAGSPRTSRVTWTMDDAQRAKLTGKDNWRNYPRAMLLARATTELCRMIFPDVLAGISHSIEELHDGGGLDVLDLGPPEVVDGARAAAQAPRATAQARRAATSPATAQEATVETVAPPTRGEIPPLPGEDDIVDAELVEHVPDVDDPDVPAIPDPDPVDEWPDGSDEYPPDGDPPPAEQRPALSGPAMIATILNDAGIRNRDHKLAIVGRIIGRDIGSTNDLTSAETGHVIGELRAMSADEIAALVPAEPEPVSATARTSAVTPPEEWTGDRWREFLKARKAKVAVVLKEAHRLGAERTPPVMIGTLDDLAGSGLCSELVGWIEDHT